MRVVRLHPGEEISYILSTWQTIVLGKTPAAGFAKNEKETF